MSDSAAQDRYTQEYQAAFARRPRITVGRVVRGVSRVVLWLAFAVPALVASGWAAWAPRTGRGASVAMARRALDLALDPGETVVEAATVSQRHWWRYFHPTYGVLAYTERRIVWVGAMPRALIEWDAEEPVAFETRSWPHDSVRIIPTRFVFGTARGIALSRYDAVRADSGRRWDIAAPVPRDAPRALFAVARDERPAVRRVTVALERRQAVLRADAERERQRDAYERWLARQPVYHIVRPGDALSAVAATYGLTPDSLRALNGREGDRIRIGERLLVRAGS
jgi:hypothetical protein